MEGADLFVEKDKRPERTNPYVEFDVGEMEMKIVSGCMCFGWLTNE